MNVVFVGLEPGQVNESEFLSGLPSQYQPTIRSRLFYGLVEELGIDYSYDVDVKYASTSWENTFFTALKGLATPADRTEFQEVYNEQDGTRDVGQNHFIDAPTVEKWLIDHAPSGVDTRENTIFFVNWWGRSDFIDHVYTKIGEPDPDTGHDFGLLNESRKIIAWGGTTPDDEETGLGARGERRVWFFDLSAGPEAWAGNFDITNADLDDDDEPDYRIPVAWEYAGDGYRSPSALTGDLSLLARYGAINLLFTSSPIYPPDLTPELLPSVVNLDLNTYEAWPGVDASALYQKQDYLRHELGELFPEFPLTSDNQDLKLRGKAKQCYVAWLADEPCFDDRPAVSGLREPLPLPRAEHQPLPRPEPQVRRPKQGLRGARVQLRDGGRPRGPVPRLCRRQLRRRNAELHLQLGLARTSSRPATGSRRPRSTSTAITSG